MLVGWGVGWGDLQAMKPDAPEGGGLVRLRERRVYGGSSPVRRTRVIFGDWGGGFWGRCIVNDGYDA